MEKEEEEGLMMTSSFQQGSDSLLLKVFVQTSKRDFVAVVWKMEEVQEDISQWRVAWYFAY